MRQWLAVVLMTWPARCSSSQVWGGVGVMGWKQESPRGIPGGLRGREGRYQDSAHALCSCLGDQGFVKVRLVVITCSSVQFTS